MKKSSLSAVVPAFNEAKTISTVVEKLLSVPYLLEIIVVDDCSTDSTAEIVQSLAENSDLIRVIRHDRNRGKTAALKSGFEVSRGDIVVVQDADLEYDSSEIANVIQPIVDGIADVVYGSRFLVRRATRVLYYYHYLGNKLLTALSNLFTNVNLTDVETGYKAFRGEIIRNMIISSEGFGFEIEVTAKVAKLHCVLYEVPISYYGRTYGEGKKIGFKDAIAAFWYIFRYNVLCTVKNSYRNIPITSLVSNGRELHDVAAYPESAKL